MKRILLAVLLAALSAAAYSQAPADKPAAAPAAAPAPAMKEEAKPAAPQKDITIVQGPGQSAVKEDARHCLEHSNQTEIIKCAEPYLPAKK
jgi:hypothetical protein